MRDACQTIALEEVAVNRPLTCRILVAALATMVAVSAHAASSTVAARPRVGLALSGGGARGAAHIGVLQVLEEHRIPVDYVTGTSMGALVGGLYASGFSPVQLDSVIASIDWNETFADNIPRRDRSFRRKRDDDLFLVKHKPGLRGGRLLFPPGILDGHRVDLLLKRLSLPVVTVRDFDRLRIPYRAVAADIVNGQAVVLSRGDLALAMRSSMSIPTAFAPRVIDGRLLVDGGIVDNLPIDLVRRMGADVVVAVDISTPPMKQDGLNSVIGITTQLATLSAEQNKARQIASLAPPSVFIRPDLGTVTVASFEHAADAVAAGRRAALAALGELEPLALSPEEWNAHLAERAARCGASGPPVIDAVRLVNRSRLDDRVLAERLDVPIGEPLDVARLERGLERIYGLELFESVYYDVAPGENGNVLTVTARERSWGPDYLQGGVAVFEDFEGPNFNVAAAYSRTGIDGWNGEWRTGLQVGQEPGAWTDFYQPLDPGLRHFVELELTAGERSINQFDQHGRKRSELGLTRFGGSLAVGRELGTWSEARVGVLREGGRISVQVGDPGVPASRYDDGEAFAQFAVDRLDEIGFPRHGANLLVRYAAGLAALGASTAYEQVRLEAGLYGTRGRNTGTIGLVAGTTPGNDAPFERRFRLGGFGQLSGLEQDELVGQHAVLFRGGLYRRVADFQVLPVYAGLLGEYGNVFATGSSVHLADGIAAGTLFVGMDTLLGPLCLAYGRAEGDRGNYYVMLGQPLGGRRLGFWAR